MPMMLLGVYWLSYWIFFLVVMAILFVPVVKILRRTGHSGWWVLLYFVPIANIIGLWVFAFAHWPALDRGHET
jgi:hypothetical protein